MGFHHHRYRLVIIILALATTIFAESSTTTTNVDPCNGDPCDVGVATWRRIVDRGCSLPDINNNMLARERDRYISYAALAANNIPCGKRGRSYYDCSGHKRMNPYRRGCTAITGCYRWTH